MSYNLKALKNGGSEELISGERTKPTVDKHSKWESVRKALHKRGIENPSDSEIRANIDHMEINGSKVPLAEARTVAKGDSLWKIARSVLESRGIENPSGSEIRGMIKTLTDMNDISDPNKIRIHSRLLVPCSYK